MLTTPAWPQWPMLRRAPSLSHASISNDLHRAVTVHRGVPDHRSRKRWFTPAAIKIVDEGLDELRAIVGPRSADLIRVALWACLERCERAAVLVGFTSAAQVRTNLTCLGARPAAELIARAQAVMAAVQARPARGAEASSGQTLGTAP